MNLFSWRSQRARQRATANTSRSIQLYFRTALSQLEREDQTRAPSPRERIAIWTVSSVARREQVRRLTIREDLSTQWNLILNCSLISFVVQIVFLFLEIPDCVSQLQQLLASLTRLCRTSSLSGLYLSTEHGAHLGSDQLGVSDVVNTSGAQTSNFIVQCHPSKKVSHNKFTVCTVSRSIWPIEQDNVRIYLHTS